jgi:hypothetical protein
VRRAGNGNGRFRIRRDDCLEYGRLLISYVETPKPDDSVVTAWRARVFVAQDAEESVEPFTLDVRKVGSERRL